MIDHSDKKLDYALRAIQHPQLRETDEFLQWIGIPENKELFLELMACKEAVIRENLQRKRKYRKKMRILAIASSAAADTGFSDSFFASFHFFTCRTADTFFCCEQQ